MRFFLSRCVHTINVGDARATAGLPNASVPVLNKYAKREDTIVFRRQNFPVGETHLKVDHKNRVRRQSPFAIGLSRDAGGNG